MINSQKPGGSSHFRLVRYKLTFRNLTGKSTINDAMRFVSAISEITKNSSFLRSILKCYFSLLELTCFPLFDVNFMCSSFQKFPSLNSMYIYNLEKNPCLINLPLKTKNRKGKKSQLSICFGIDPPLKLLLWKIHHRAMIRSSCPKHAIQDIWPRIFRSQKKNTKLSNAKTAKAGVEKQGFFTGRCFDSTSCDNA